MAARMKRKKDMKVYRRTAVLTKRINRNTAQGGTRF